jgi:hypothetical protein
MSELVPEQRPDKNGHLVTRWVKPVGKTTGAKVIPTPVVPAAVSESTIQSLNDHIDSFSLEDAECAAVLKRNLLKMGPHAEAFMDLFEFHAGASDLFYDIADVTETIYGAHSTVKEQHRGTVLMNFMEILPPYFDGKDEDGIEAAHFTMVLFAGINGYEATEPYTERERAAFTEAAAVVENIRPLPEDDRGLELLGFKPGPPKVQLADRRSVDILLEHAETADLIGTELMKRQTFHPDIVQQVATHGVMRDGSL